MEIALVIVILGMAVYFFATERFPVDLVAMMILAALLVIGVLGEWTDWIDARRWITPQDGISGFSNAATVTVGAMFVLSAGLEKTGSLGAVGALLIRIGGRESALLLVLMAVIGVISAFVNNTAAVAVFLPLVLAVCARHKVSPSKLLIPLSFASQFGGVCTLIGTSTNLLVNSISIEAGHGAFRMFEFSKLGLILFGVGALYFFLVGRRLLPARQAGRLVETYGLGKYITELRVLPDSPLIGKTVRKRELAKNHDVMVLELLRDKRMIWSPLNEPLRAGDILLVRGAIGSLMNLKTATGLEIEPEFKLQDSTLQEEDLTLVEALVAPQSRLVGRTLVETDFRRYYRTIVLAVQRRGRPIREKLSRVRLRIGDALLLQGRKEEMERLRRDRNFIVLEEVERPTVRRKKVPFALAIIGAVVGLAALNVMPILVSAILGCVAMVVTRCITLEEAYAAIDWKVIFLLAGVLPLGLAMENSGAAQWISQHSVELTGRYGPTAVLGALFVLTTALTAVMSNNATAVLLAPIAISTALDLGVSAKPFLMAVMFAASTCFATPIGYQTNVMVYNPGGYRFADFMKVGIPLNILFCVISVYFIPRFWPY